MNKLYFAAAMSAALLGASAANAGTHFLTYEGKDAIQEGRGGEKKVIDGIEFWMSGAPPHRFQVLGSVTDERHKSGLVGVIAMSGLDKAIAATAKRAGGDAVVLVEEHDDVTGTISTVFSDSSGGFSVGRNIKSHASHFMVVKYLDTSPPSSTAPTPGPG